MEQNANQLEDWINQFGDYLYSWAHFRLSDDHLAKDLVQDTFLAAIQSFAHFEGRSSIKTWLTSILNNKIRDHFRKQKNRNFSLED
ncbi:MAG: sigma-70 family RNA polymerase sigma factor, partial [Bacteroidota bacterium]|nr:sigma-70 family RNA polymerase sigma factor [Bacteroidota bacterium]MDX5431231.1 sigma-70 family RNA polymerase sigma factor [Bacteroidota bacterium]MDX5469970.1 sigma-70 family RNA polymerase sigma factor [Bacteroidota bacterium]